MSEPIKKKNLEGDHFKRHHFKPNGRPKLTPEQKTIKQLSQINLVNAWGLIMNMSQSELLALVNQTSENKDLNTGLNAALAATILKGIEGGFLSQIDLALNRVIGPVKQTVEHSGSLTLAEMVLESIKPETKETK
jgi:hypothetical protein